MIVEDTFRRTNVLNFVFVDFSWRVKPFLFVAGYSFLYKRVPQIENSSSSEGQMRCSGLGDQMVCRRSQWAKGKCGTPRSVAVCCAKGKQGEESERETKRVKRAVHRLVA